MSPLVGCPGPGGFLSGGAFVRGSFARGDFCPGGLCPFPQVQFVYAPSRLSIRPPLPKFSGYVEVEAHYIFHPSTGSDPFLRS